MHILAALLKHMYYMTNFCYHIKNNKYFVRRSTSHATKGRNEKNMETRFSPPLIKLED